jgi:hypothetical protein
LLFAALVQSYFGTWQCGFHAAMNAACPPIRLLIPSGCASDCRIRFGESGGPVLELSRGILAKVVMPHSNDCQLDEEALRKKVQSLLGNRAGGIVAISSLGEFLHVSEAEQVRKGIEMRSAGSQYTPFENIAAFIRIHLPKPMELL